MKRYPRPDFCAINTKRLQWHGYAIHSVTSESHKGMRGNSTYVECRSCFILERMGCKIAFGECGLLAPPLYDLTTRLVWRVMYNLHIRGEFKSRLF